MGKPSRKSKPENNLMKRYESITEKKYEENVHPSTEKGNETEFSSTSRDKNSKAVVTFYKNKEIKVCSDRLCL